VVNARSVRIANGRSPNGEGTSAWPTNPTSPHEAGRLPNRQRASEEKKPVVPGESSSPMASTSAADPPTRAPRGSPADHRTLRSLAQTSSTRSTRRRLAGLRTAHLRAAWRPKPEHVGRPLARRNPNATAQAAARELQSSASPCRSETPNGSCYQVSCCLMPWKASSRLAIGLQWLPSRAT